MKITIRYTPECPHVDEAERRVREALRSIGGRAKIEREVVVSLSEAERLFFTGSPTILVDGFDPFEEGGEEPALACRIYQTPEGLEGAPTVEQLCRTINALAGATESPPGVHPI